MLKSSEEIIEKYLPSLNREINPMSKYETRSTNMNILLNIEQETTP